MPTPKFPVRRLILWSFLVLLSVFIAAGSAPIVAAAPARAARRPAVAGWLRGGKNETRPLALLSQHLDVFNEINPFSYTIEANGTLTANDPVTDKALVDLAKTNNILVVPTVASGWDNARATARILGDVKLRAAHLDSIMKVARQPGIDGIDLDYENLPPDSQKNYTAFVAALATMLHSEGKVLSVTVPPKSSATDSCVSCQFADYAALGAVVDRFRVMAYEYHGKNAAPGPIAPVWWMRQVMTYATSQVPRERVMLAIRLYGYDWGSKDNTPALWWVGVQKLKTKYHGQTGYIAADGDGGNGESWMSYSLPSPHGPHCHVDDDDCNALIGEPHVVWFVDARYVQASWDIVRDLRLAGLVLWRPGGEDPAIWDVFSAPPPVTVTQ